MQDKISTRTGWIYANLKEAANSIK